MGLVGLTRGLAAALGPHGVTVNAVGPGLMQTPGTEALYGVGANRFENVAGRRAMRRLLDPLDVAALVEFLVREEAGMITGQTIFVDGGEGRG
jgi:NAD(P)-dependent dehydrogenase (short-subunit alcohol dehydrogenase family)